MIVFFLSRLVNYIQLDFSGHYQDDQERKASKNHNYLLRHRFQFKWVFQLT